MDGASSANDQDSFFPQLAKCLADLRMKSRIVATIEADDRCWRSSIRKHSFRGYHGIVMPVKFWIFLDIVKFSLLKQVNDAVGEILRDIDGIVEPEFLRNDIHLEFGWILLRCNFEAVSKFLPVRTNVDNSFNVVLESTFPELSKFPRLAR